MFDLWLNRSIKAMILAVALSFTALLSGFNPHSVTLMVKSEPQLPTPVIYTEADMLEREADAPEREVLIVNESEFDCLRKNVYFEARNQGLQAQRAVALVTMKRVASPFYPDSICEVVKKGQMWQGVMVRNKCHFSWFCDGKSDQPNLKHPDEAQAWASATSVAMEALTGKIEDFLGVGATHYHANYVKPSWAKDKRYVAVATIEDHIIYRDTKDKSNWLDNKLIAEL